MTPRERAYAVAMLWFDDKEPDNMQVAALAAHVELAITEHVRTISDIHAVERERMALQINDEYASEVHGYLDAAGEKTGRGNGIAYRIEQLGRERDEARARETQLSNALTIATERGSKAEMDLFWMRRGLIQWCAQLREKPMGAGSFSSAGVGPFIALEVEQRFLSPAPAQPATATIDRAEADRRYAFSKKSYGVAGSELIKHGCGCRYRYEGSTVTDEPCAAHAALSPAPAQPATVLPEPFARIVEQYATAKYPEETDAEFLKRAAPAVISSNRPIDEAARVAINEARSHAHEGQMPYCRICDAISKYDAVREGK